MEKPFLQLVTNRFIAIVFVTINFLLLLSLLVNVFKIIGVGANAVFETLGLFLALLSILPAWNLSKYVLPFKESKIKVKAKKKKSFLLMGNVVLLLATLISHLSLPFFSDLNFESGQEAHSNKQLHTAINKYEKALLLQSGRSDVHFSLANLYEEISKYPLAEENYWLAIRNHNSPFEAYNNLARLYIKSKAYDDALDLLYLALQAEHFIDGSQSPTEKNAVIHKNIAWAYSRLGEYEKSLHYINKAIASFIEEGVIRSHLISFCIKAAAEIKTKKKDTLSNQHFDNCIANTNTTYTGIEREFERDTRKLYQAF
ncbi:MAG: DUF2225 domain-containing protein [Cellvibrionaceae bacterium]